jgi:hypothetical protein
MLGLLTIFLKKKRLQYYVGQYNLISQKLNLSHYQSYCVTSCCKILFVSLAFLYQTTGLGVSSHLHDPLGCGRPPPLATWDGKGFGGG